MASEEEFGPWIPHKAGEPCPIPDAEGGDYQVKWADGDIDTYIFRAGEAAGWASGTITHYRLREPSPDWKAIAEKLAEAANGLMEAIDTDFGSTRRSDACDFASKVLRDWKQANA